MTLCGKCGTQKVLTFDASVSGFGLTCVCDIPEASAASSVSTSYYSTRSVKAGRETPISASFVPNSTPISSELTGQPKIYRCCLCSGQVGVSSLYKHAKVCSIKLALPFMPNNYKCLACSREIDGTRLDFHQKQCPTLTSWEAQQRNLRDKLPCPICNQPFTSANLETHLEKCRELAVRLEAGEIYICADCGIQIKITRKASHPASCPKNLVVKQAKVSKIAPIVKFEKVLTQPSSGVICPICKENVKVGLFKQHNYDCTARYELIQDYIPNIKSTYLNANPNKDPMGLKDLLRQKRQGEIKSKGTIDPDLGPKTTIDEASTDPVDDNSKMDCPFCAGKRKGLDLEEHFWNCPSINRQNIKRKSRNVNYNEQHLPFNEDHHSPGSRKGNYQDLGGDDRMDATRGHGYSARENGRFGSHPIHDDYDD